MMKFYDYSRNISLQSLYIKDLNGWFYKTLRYGLAAVLSSHLINISLNNDDEFNFVDIEDKEKLLFNGIA